MIATMIKDLMKCLYSLRLGFIREVETLMAKKCSSMLHGG